MDVRPGRDAALSRLFEPTNRVVATIATPLTGENASIAFGEGAVGDLWPGQRRRLPGRPGRQPRHRDHRVAGGAFGIVVAAGTVWVTQFLPEPDPGIVARIDASNNPLRSPIEVPNMPGAIRAGLDAV
jgi:hypothetical protein